MSYLQHGHVEASLYERSDAKYLVKSSESFLAETAAVTFLEAGFGSHLTKSESSFLADGLREISGGLGGALLVSKKHFLEKAPKKSIVDRELADSSGPFLEYKGEDEFLEYDWNEFLDEDDEEHVQEDVEHHVAEDMEEHLDQSAGETSDEEAEDFSHAFDESMDKLLPPHWFQVNASLFRDRLTGAESRTRPKVIERFEVFDLEAPELKLMIARFCGPKENSATVLKRLAEELGQHRSRLVGLALEKLRVWKHEKQKAMMHDSDRLKAADKSERQKEYMELLDSEKAGARKRHKAVELNAKVLKREFEDQQKKEAKLERDREHKDRSAEHQREAEERRREKMYATSRRVKALSGEALRRKLEEDERRDDIARERIRKQERDRQRKAALAARERSQRGAQVSQRRGEIDAMRRQRFREEEAKKEEAIRRLDASRREVAADADAEERERLRIEAAQNACRALMKILEEKETGIELMRIPDEYQEKYETEWKSEQWFLTDDNDAIVDGSSLLRSTTHRLGSGYDRRILHRKHWEKLAVLKADDSDLLYALKDCDRIGAVIDKLSTETSAIASAERVDRFEAKRAADGRIYYVDHVDESTTWDDPRPLPYGWRSAKNRQGRVYYIDDSSKKTQFENPLGDLVPKGPPPKPFVAKRAPKRLAASRLKTAETATRRRREAIDELLNFLLGVKPTGVREQKFVAEFRAACGKRFAMDAFPQRTIRGIINGQLRLKKNIKFVGFGARTRLLHKDIFDVVNGIAPDTDSLLDALENCDSLEEVGMYILTQTQQSEEDFGFDDDFDFADEGLDSGDDYKFETAAPRQQPLPDGWEAKRTGGGRMYYIDHSTHKTTWDRPLPPGWRQGKTGNGRVYYISDATKETQWNDPRDDLPIDI